MTLLGFQQALSQLIISPAFCSQVLNAPDETLKEFSLTSLEYQRLVSIAAMPGVKIGTVIYRSFRLSMLINTLPKTYQLLKLQNLFDVIYLYWKTQLPQNYYYMQEAVRFSEFIFDQLKQEKIQSEFLEEILRFDLAVLSLASQITEQIPVNKPIKTPPLRAGFNNKSEPENVFLVLNPRFRLVKFGHDPEVLLTSLDESQLSKRETSSALLSIPQGSYYLLVSQTFLNQLHFEKVSPKLGEILLACNKPNSITNLCTQLSVTVEDLELLINSGYLCVQSGSSD